MDTDNGFDIMPWLKTDLISGFSDLLDDRIADADLQSSAATLNSTDLGVGLPSVPCVDFSTDQVRLRLQLAVHSPPSLHPFRGDDLLKVVMTLSVLWSSIDTSAAWCSTSW